MTQNEQPPILRIPRCKLVHKLIQRLYHQNNVQRVCEGDDMLVPMDQLEDWMNDMGVILGKVIMETLQDMAEKGS